MIYLVFCLNGVTIYQNIFFFQSDVSESGAYTEQEFEEAFERMKKAAGVNSIKQVVDRFMTQGKTTQVNS